MAQHWADKAGVSDTLGGVLFVQTGVFSLQKNSKGCYDGMFVCGFRLPESAHLQFKSRYALGNQNNMKALSDFLAVILFVGTYLLTKNMVWATAVAVVIGVAQAAYLWLKFKKLNAMQWVSLIVVVVFGGATILLNDPVYIMLKTTVICWLTAAAILIAQLCGKNGLKVLMGQELSLPESVWTRLAYAWVVFFFAMGAVNLGIAYPFTPEREAFWMNYKLYGYLPLIVIFSLAQGIYIFRHLPQEKP